MLYVAVFFAGMAFPYVAWWSFCMLHDYVYMPLEWLRGAIEASKQPGGPVLQKARPFDGRDTRGG